MVVSLLSQKEVGPFVVVVTITFPNYSKFCCFLQPPSEIVQSAKWRMLKSKAMSQHVSHLSDNLSECVDKSIAISQKIVNAPPISAEMKAVAGAGGSNGGIAHWNNEKVIDNVDNGSNANDGDGSDDSMASDSGDDSAADTGDSDDALSEEDESCREEATTGTRERISKQFTALTCGFGTASSSSSCSSVEISNQGETMQSVLLETVKRPQLSYREATRSDKTSASGTSRGTPSQVVASVRQGKDPEMMSSFFIGSLSAKKKALQLVSSDPLPTIVIRHSLLSVKQKKPRNRLGQRARRQ